MTSSAEKPPFQQLCEQFDYTPKGRPLVTDEVAEILSAKRNTLEQYRLKGIGPKFYTPPGSRRVYYAERDVLEWLASGVRTSTSQHA